MDPLGVEVDIVPVHRLKRWNSISSGDIQTDVQRSAVEAASRFPYRDDLNRKVILWAGDITCLDAHAVVNSTDEAFRDRNEVSQRIFARAGPKLRDEILLNIKVCRTGEAKITKGYKLPARYIIHTVGPKYNIRYQTAAEGALFNCYRNALQLAREYKLSSIAFSVVNSLRRGYPPHEGAHIALRTVRRFLEKFGDSFESVIFAVEESDVGIYQQLMPLYFPRTYEEELHASHQLPEDIGNEDGEPVNLDRQIRIIDNPHHRPDADESVDLLADLDSSVNVGKTEFAKMTEDVDCQRQNRSNSSASLDQLTLEMQRRQKYERLLRRARTEDLSEVSGIGCLYQSGVDKFGRPVIVFVGKWFKFKEINLDKALLYLIYMLDTMVKQDYIIVYFHTITTGDNHPSMSWIREVYSVLEYKYKKNLKAFYIVHPTFWTKLMCWWFTTFMAPAIKHKVHSLVGVEYLYSIMDMNQLEIPAFITEHDMSINGIRYHVPSSGDGL